MRLNKHGGHSKKKIAAGSSRPATDASEVQASHAANGHISVVSTSIINGSR